MTGNKTEAAALPHWGERLHVFPEWSHLLESSGHGQKDEIVESAFKKLNLKATNYSHNVPKHSNKKEHFGASRWRRG